MRIIFYSLIFMLISSTAQALNWGCANVTQEEMDKAKEVLKNAKEILVFNSENKLVEISYEDIKYDITLKPEDVDNRKFYIEDIFYGGADEFFVRFNDNEKYQNLAFIIKCTPNSIEIIKELDENRNYQPLRERFFSILEKYHNCSKLQSDETINTPNNIINNRIKCYIDTAHELFDAFHPSNHQLFKDNLHLFVENYSKVLNDIYNPLELKYKNSLTEDFIATQKEHFISNLIYDYIEEAGDSMDYIDKSADL